jgi:hypothetical protein
VSHLVGAGNPQPPFSGSIADAKRTTEPSLQTWQSCHFINGLKQHQQTNNFMCSSWVWLRRWQYLNLSQCQKVRHTYQSHSLKMNSLLLFCPLLPRYGGKTYRAVVKIVRTADQVMNFCRQVCAKLECCPNLLSPVLISETCPENCSVHTKTRYSEYKEGKDTRYAWALRGCTWVLVCLFVVYLFVLVFVFNSLQTSSCEYLENSLRFSVADPCMS